MSESTTSFFNRHEFLIRRLHSLSGLLPVGAYMVVHLVVNASLLNGPGTFQANVNQIHALGRLLPVVEWTFIFLPIIFHAAVGVWIIRTGKSNHDNYRYVANWRYTLQRWTGVVAVVFIFMHVFHLHGWFHSDWWLSRVAEPLGMANFRAYNAASTLAEAMAGPIWPLWPVFYLVGIVACVFHLANGIWTMGITWGVWISPRAQRYATWICTAGGGLLLMIGLSALAATLQVDPEEARRVEDAMYQAKVASGEITPNPHKRSSEHGVDEAAAGDEAADDHEQPAGDVEPSGESGQEAAADTPVQSETASAD